MSKVRVAYVHNVLKGYKLPLLNRVASARTVWLRGLFGQSHWKVSKFHRDCAEEVPWARTLATLDLYCAYRGRDLHLFFCPALPLALTEADPDVVIAGISNWPNNLLLAAWCSHAKVPYLWHGIGSVYRERTTLRRLMDPVLRRFVQGANGGLAFNSRAKRFYCEEYGCDPGSIEVVPNVVDTSKVVTQQAEARAVAERLRAQYKLRKGQTILYVGNLRAAKRVNVLIEAMECLAAAGRRYKCIIVGEGPSRNQLESLAVRKEVDDRVLFVGSVYEGVSAFFQAADVFVLPGLGGLAITEALANGVPVICGRADGTEEDVVINGVTGYRLEGAASAREFAKAIDKLLSRDARRSRMGAQARQYLIENFSIETARERFIERIVRVG